MKITINKTEFRDAFNTWQGGQYKNNFSYEGLTKLYEYLEDYEESTDEQIDFDMIAICCDYNESTYKEILKSYNPFSDEEIKKYDEEGTLKEKIKEYIEENTSYFEVDEETIIYQCF